MTELTASQERALYESDRPAWLTYVAVRMAEQLRAADDASITTRWGALPRDYQCAVWKRLTPATRNRIRVLRALAQAAPVAYNVPVPTHAPVANCPQPDQGNIAEACA